MKEEIKPQQLYEFERRMDAIFDEAFFAFSQRFKDDPSSSETFLRYLKDVLFLDANEHLALYKTYKRPFMERESKGYPISAEVTQDTPPTKRRLRRI